MKTALDPRHQKRQKVVQELFAFDAQNKSQAPHTPPVADLTDTAQKIIAKLDFLDKLISKNAPEREINQINQIDLAILRVAVFEITFDRSAPTKAIIDEAVEIAKEFGSESSPQFVNGVLGQVFSDPDRLRSIIGAKLGVEEEKLTAETLLQADLNISPLEVADLLALLERELGLTLPTTTQCHTVGDIFEAIEEAKAE